MPLFTDEQMIEIINCRERLLAIKNKAQPFPEDELQPLEPQLIPPRKKQADYLQEQVSRIRDNQQEHFKHHSSIDKKKVQRTPII